MLLFNPGPTNVAPEVRAMAASSVICHRDEVFRNRLCRIRNDLVECLGGAGSHRAVMFVASGTGANEAILSSIAGPVLVLVNGPYSRRLLDICRRFGKDAIPAFLPPGQAVDPSALSFHFRERPDIRYLVLVHLETTTGILAPLHALGEIAAGYGAGLIVDGISSVGAHPVDLRADNISFCSVNSNKCLESIPGLSFVIGQLDELRSLGAIAARGFYFDLYSNWERQEQKEVTFTAAVHSVAAFEVALQRLIKETVPQRIRRYRTLCERMRYGLNRLGIKTVEIPPEVRSNVVVHAHLPPGVRFSGLQEAMQRRGCYLYSDPETLQNGRFFVATMGAIGMDEIDYFLSQLKEVLREMEVPCKA